MSERLNFAAWQALEPEAAASELRRRLGELPESLRRAVIASDVSEEQLADAFRRAPAGLPLSRVPCLMKDLFDLGGAETRAGSTFLHRVRPARPAGEDGAFGAALRAAGAVLGGKTQMVEFAYGLTGENAHYGDCPHPRFPDRLSGGSSSGSAFAVAAGLVPLATGSDTGGSIRVPAALCGIYGMRLTPYHPWIKDAVPLVPAFDTPGWFTANAGDMRIALDALLTATKSGEEGAATAATSMDAAPRRGCYLEVPGLDPEVRTACETAAARFAPPPGRKLRAALLASFAHAEAAYQALGNLAAWETHRGWFAEHSGEYGPGTRARLEVAQQVTPEQTSAARQQRDAVMRTWEEYFNDYDFLLLPATPFPAQTREQLTAENRKRILDLTAPASLGGLPVLTVPLPLSEDRTGLTTGLQIVVRDAADPILRSLLRQWEPIAGVAPAATESDRPSPDRP